MTDDPPLDDPFAPLPPDESDERNALARALQTARGFTLLFARCDRSDLRNRLIAALKSQLPHLRVQEIPVYEPTRHLLDALGERLANPPPDAVFVYGLESWLPSNEEARTSPFILNLNAARNHFPQVVPCPLVFWLPEHLLTAIARGAPDFFSVRSGLYFFPDAPLDKAAMAGELTLSSLTAMAGLPYQEKLGRIATLEEMLREYQALPPKQRDLGAEARLLNSLGGLHLILGRYAEAETLLQQALGVREKALGPEHPDVAASLNNLAELYHYQGKFTEAEPLYQRSLAIWEQSLGKDHPDVALSLYNLAVLYHAQGKLAQVEPLYQRSLAIREQSLGKDHPDVAQSLHALAFLYHDQGKLTEAESLFQRSLAIQEQALGKEHPSVAQSLNNLAGLYHTQGKLAEAEPLYQRSLAIAEQSLGKEHPNVATGLGNYAALLHAMGRESEAGAIEARAGAIRAKGV